MENKFVDGLKSFGKIVKNFVDKFLAFLLWVFVIGLVLGVIWLLVSPIVWWTDKSEMRLYIRVALVLLVVVAFGVLRIYNSIVQNTRVMFKVHQELNKLLAELPTLSRAVHQLGLRAESLKAVTQNQTKALTQLSEDAREVLAEMKHRKVSGDGK